MRRSELSGFTLRQLEFFVAAVDEGSVTAAARRLHVSPGGISVALSELESALKVQLTVRRRGKGVSVTPAGRWVYEHAQEMLDRSADIGAVARIVRGELAGPLRVGCFTTLSPWMFPRVALHFTENHPGVDLHLVEGQSAELQQRMRDGELDVTFMYSNHLDADVAGEIIAPVRVRLAVSAEHRLASWDTVPLRELREEPAILLALQPAGGHVEAMLRAAGFEPDVRWRSANVETIRAMVARGLGYTVIMGRPHGDVTYEGLPIVYRDISDELPANNVVVAYPQGAVPTAKTKALIAFCQEAFGSEGYSVI